MILTIQVLDHMVLMGALEDMVVMVIGHTDPDPMVDMDIIPMAKMTHSSFNRLR